jgi:hypothetical protein
MTANRSAENNVFTHRFYLNRGSIFAEDWTSCVTSPHPWWPTPSKTFTNQRPGNLALSLVIVLNSVASCGDRLLHCVMKPPRLCSVVSLSTMNDVGGQCCCQGRVEMMHRLSDQSPRIEFSGKHSHPPPLATSAWTMLQRIDIRYPIPLPTAVLPFLPWASLGFPP